MVALIVIGSIILFLVILLFSPVLFAGRYDGEVFHAKIRYLFLTISIAPKKPKEKPKPKKRKKTKTQARAGTGKKAVPLETAHQDKRRALGVFKNGH